MTVNNDHAITSLNETSISLDSAGAAANGVAARHSFHEYRTRRALQTTRRQRADLRLFAEYLAAVNVSVDADSLMSDPASWRGVTWGIVAAFVKWSLEQGYAVSSINVRLSTIKTYCKLAAQAGAIDPTEYAMIRTVTGYTFREQKNVDVDRAAGNVPTRRDNAKKDTATVLTAAQVKALKAQSNTPQGRRDALLICLAFDHGLRVGEIVGLTVGAINLADATMTFYRPKVDKVQTHNLTRDSLRAARAYLENDAPLLKTDKLMRSSIKGGKLAAAGMTERAITKRLGALAKGIGIEGVSAHDGRHTWATRAATNKTDPFALQEAGGWNSLAMPRRYVEAARIANEGINLGDE